MLYENNEQLVIEFKKLLLNDKISQRDISKTLNISPQALQNILNKKQLSFADMKRVLDCIGYKLDFNFVRPTIETGSASKIPIQHANNGYDEV